MTSTKLSISAAHRLTGKSKTTLRKHMAKGLLSYELDDKGNKRIDASELERVYGIKQEAENGKGRDAANSETVSVKSEAATEVRFLRERVEREEIERKRERDQLLEQIQDLREALAKSQEGHNRATLLLEDHSSKADQWQDRLSDLEKRIGKQEQETQKYKRALHVERNKSLFEKIFQTRRA